MPLPEEKKILFFLAQCIVKDGLSADGIYLKTYEIYGTLSP